MFQNPQSIGRERMLAFMIVVLAIFSVFFGGKWIRRHITPPAESRASAFRTLDEQEEAQKQELKKLDTDHDNISDFDELFIYRTSPYLEDTDSDGFSDKVEIESGNDPNCPKGKACMGEEIGGVAVATSTLLLPPEGGGVGAALIAPDLVTLGSKSLAEMRAALEKAGIAKGLLDSVDDKTLKELFEESLKEAGNP